MLNHRLEPDDAVFAERSPPSHRGPTSFHPDGYGWNERNRPALDKRAMTRLLILILFYSRGPFSSAFWRVVLALRHVFAFLRHQASPSRSTDPIAKKSQPLIQYRKSSAPVSPSINSLPQRIRLKYWNDRESQQPPPTPSKS